jgi:hypothetical protein
MTRIALGDLCFDSENLADVLQAVWQRLRDQIYTELAGICGIRIVCHLFIWATTIASIRISNVTAQ